MASLLQPRPLERPTSCLGDGDQPGRTKTSTLHALSGGQVFHGELPIQTFLRILHLEGHACGKDHGALQHESTAH